MEYRRMGSTGLKVSALGFGTWVSFGNQVDLEHAVHLLRKCLDLGVNYFDTAEVYANGKAEEILGQALKQIGRKRSSLVISTKIFWGGQGPNDRGLSRKHIIEGMRGSLERLQMGYVDIVFCHRPDPNTTIEETVRAMNHVLDRGWSFYWGTSEWSPRQITEACEVARRLNLIGPSVEQPEYNLLKRDKVEQEFLPLYSPYGIGLTTWSPLASGVLTGKYTRDSIPEGSRLALPNYKDMATRQLVEETLSKVDRLRPIAKQLDATLAQLCLAWCLKNPHVTSVITGATKEAQVEENLQALKLLPQMTADIMAAVDDAMHSDTSRTA